VSKRLYIASKKLFDGSNRIKVFTWQLSKLTSFGIKEKKELNIKLSFFCPANVLETFIIVNEVFSVWNSYKGNRIEENIYFYY